MITIILLVDIDDSEKLSDWRRKIEASAPLGYTISRPHCAGWSRNFETGAVSMQIGFTVESPPDILPRIKVR
jgi:hypothetical protein